MNIQDAQKAHELIKQFNEFTELLARIGGDRIRYNSAMKINISNDFLGRDINIDKEFGAHLIDLFEKLLIDKVAEISSKITEL